MLNRRNSISLQMPFKWRPFDLYNDIHINHATDHNVTSATLTNSSNYVRCKSNCDHLMLCSNIKKNRQNSHGSSSGSSCVSLSTTTHFDSNVDSASSTGTIKSNRSLEFYRKLLSRSDLNHNKYKYVCNSATINCCCGSNCQNIMRNRVSYIHNDDTNCESLNCILNVPPFACDKQIVKTNVISLTSSNKCKHSTCEKFTDSDSITFSENRLYECCIHNCNIGYFDNWQLTDVIANRSMDGSKYDEAFAL